MTNPLDTNKMRYTIMTYPTLHDLLTEQTDVIRVKYSKAIPRQEKRLAVRVLISLFILERDYLKDLCFPEDIKPFTSFQAGLFTNQIATYTGYSPAYINLIYSEGGLASTDEIEEFLNTYLTKKEEPKPEPVITKSQPKNEKGYAYIVNLKMNNGQTVLKVGYTENLERRMKQLSSHIYPHYFVTGLEVVHAYEFENKASAYIMESVLHRYFFNKPNAIYVPNDRFEDCVCTDADLEALMKKYKFILDNEDNL